VLFGGREKKIRKIIMRAQIVREYMHMQIHHRPNWSILMPSCFHLSLLTCYCWFHSSHVFFFHGRNLCRLFKYSQSFLRMPQPPHPHGDWMIDDMSFWQYANVLCLWDMLAFVRSEVRTHQWVTTRGNQSMLPYLNFKKMIIQSI
jgi:hypothetical protein